MTTARGYRFLYRTRFPLWALFAFGIRLPNATAPLAMVFLGHGATGSYASGGALAAAFVIGEVAGAALLGWVGKEANVRRDVPVGLAIGAVGFILLSAGSTLSYGVLIAAAILAGAGPAQSGGALRAALGRLVDEEDVTRAYSVDSLITELVWLLAPALVAATAVTISPFLVLGVNAGLLVLAVLLALTAGASLLGVDRHPDEDAAVRPSSRRELLRAWPIYLTSAAALSLLAIAELVLPSLLEERGHSAVWSGVLLSVFAASSAVTSIAYGFRKWKGSVRTQSTVFLIATALALALMAVAPSLVLIGATLVAAGVCQAVVMITRNLSLRDDLPPSLHTGGFTFMYSVQGAGYAVSAVLASVVLDRAGAPAAIGAGLGIMVLLTIASLVAEALRRRSAPARR